MKQTMDTQIIWIALAIGLGAGILSGLIGIGGGIIMVPALVFFLGYTQHQAQGTSLAVLTLPVVILASIYYYQQCKLQGHPVDLRVVTVLAIGFLAGAFLGGRWALTLSQTQLKQIFATILIYTAIRMLAWDQWILQWFKKT
ncbi:MAG: TSUP family transporter [Bacteroidota bacterium]